MPKKKKDLTYLTSKLYLKKKLEKLKPLKSKKMLNGKKKLKPMIPKLPSSNKSEISSHKVSVLSYKKDKPQF